MIALVMAAIVVGISLLSCRSDFRALRIPNWHSLAILAAFVPAWLAAPQAFGSLWHHMAAMGMVFALTYGMFCLNLIGGGDSKLASALGLWVGLKGLFPFLFYMAIAGGLLGSMALLLRRKKIFDSPHPGGWIDQVQKGRSAVPYGVAISFGTWMSFLHSEFLYKELNEVFKIIY
jgi:prepilin peptidase CpaA